MRQHFCEEKSKLIPYPTYVSLSSSIMRYVSCYHNTLFSFNTEFHYKTLLLDYLSNPNFGGKRKSFYLPNDLLAFFHRLMSNVSHPHFFIFIRCQLQYFLNIGRVIFKPQIYYTLDQILYFKPAYFHFDKYLDLFYQYSMGNIVTNKFRCLYQLTIWDYLI